MFSYSQFKEDFVDKILSYLPQEFADYELKINTINKVNETKESLAIRPKEGSSMVPNLYLDDLYEVYRNEGMENCLSFAADSYLHGLKYVQSVNKLNIDMDKLINELDSRIYYQLIGTAANKELLRNVPHRAFKDLSIVYRISVDRDFSGGVYTTLINNELMNNNNLSEQVLFDMAKENTPKLFKPCVMSMAEMLGIPMPDDKLWVITNEDKSHGAAAILCDNVLDDLCERIGDDVYLLPSSVHEFLAVPVSEYEPEFLIGMVESANLDTVDPKEQLATSVYKYDSINKEINLVATKGLQFNINPEEAISIEPEFGERELS